MLVADNGIKTDQIASEVEARNLLITLFSDGITFDRAGTNSV